MSGLQAASGSCHVNVSVSSPHVEAASEVVTSPQSRYIDVSGPEVDVVRSLGERAAEAVLVALGAALLDDDELFFDFSSPPAGRRSIAWKSQRLAWFGQCWPICCETSTYFP